MFLIGFAFNLSKSVLLSKTATPPGDPLAWQHIVDVQVTSSETIEQIKTGENTAYSNKHGNTTAQWAETKAQSLQKKQHAV